METDTKTTDTSAQAQGSSQTDTDNTGAANTTPEKKYTDDDMNGIVKKNSSKAVNNWLKDLGITDQNRAREILSAAVANEQQTGKNSDGPDLQAMLETERADKEKAIVENILLTRSVDTAKVERAARLIDLADCRDEKGNLDRSKATAAVDELLKDWPELKKVTQTDKTGFVIGSDGNQNTAADSKGGKTKPPAQKSWNRFN